MEYSPLNRCKAKDTKTMGTNQNMFRQGDILITRVTDPNSVSLDGAKTVDRDNGRVVLAYGEVTGHAHALHDDNATLVEVANGDRYLRIVGDSEVELRHEEHSKISLTPGLYKVTRQREYSPEEIRTVAD